MRGPLVPGWLLRPGTAVSRERTSGSRARWSTWLRITGALLLAATGAIHLGLDLAGGYGSIPTIGLLFLVQAATAFVVSAVLVATPRPIASLSGALFALGTLGGYLLSLSVGLFGFHEVVTGAGIASGLMEICAFLLLSFVATSTEVPVALRRLASARTVRVLAAAVALVASSVLAVELSQPSLRGRAAGTDTVTAVRLPRYGTVLANGRGDTLYVLSTGRGSQGACSGGCLSIWPPLLVAPTVRHIRAGPGVFGRLGLIGVRGQSQATDNGYRLYTYAGDSGPRQGHGEGIVSFGGTWYLVRPRATRALTTALTAP